MTLLTEFSNLQLLAIGAIFIWTGFVRSGLGFGGAALGLPFMLFVYNQPVFWLPVIGTHLLFFSGLTLRSRLNDVDWVYLRRSYIYILIPTLVGIFGLLNLPTKWLLIFIYSVTLFYAITWALGISIRSQSPWVDKILLALGGYIAGTSLTGAPLMVAVFVHNVKKEFLRNTLFVLWFSLVSMKMSAFIALGVNIQWQTALLLIPVAAIGHVIGLKAHDHIIKNDHLFRRILGVVLVVISTLGLIYH